MSEPTIQVPVSEVVYKATKSIVATITTALGVLALVAVSISDGSLTWEEGGKLIGAIATAGATIAAVWRVPNEIKGTRDVR